MKTIGLIGGITPESTILYYRALNKLAYKQFGENHSCKVIIYLVDFGEILKLQKENNWSSLSTIIINAAQGLEQAGANYI